MSDDSAAEQLSQLSEAICGFREASFDEMIHEIEYLRSYKKIENIRNNTPKLMNAIDNLLAEIQDLDY